MEVPSVLGQGFQALKFPGLLQASIPVRADGATIADICEVVDQCLHDFVVICGQQHFALSLPEAIENSRPLCSQASKL